MGQVHSNICGNIFGPYDSWKQHCIQKPFREKDELLYTIPLISCPGHVITTTRSLVTICHFQELLSKWKNARRSRSFGPLASGFCPLTLHRDTSQAITWWSSVNSDLWSTYHVWSANPTTCKKVPSHKSSQWGLIAHIIYTILLIK